MKKTAKSESGCRNPAPDHCGEGPMFIINRMKLAPRRLRGNFVALN